MNEKGYITAFSAFCLAALVGLVGTIGAVGKVVVWRHHAQVAAELAAVAGAHAKDRGENACLSAQQVAERNGARLADCQVDGSDVQVSASRGRATQVARAGPAISPLQPRADPAASPPMRPTR